MSKNKDAFQKAIEAANSGQRFPVMDLLRDDPSIASMISKLIAPITPPQYGKDGNREPLQPNVYAFRNIANQTTQNIVDAQTTMQLLPDTELAAQIMISSILSPKDMMTLDLTMTVPEGLIAPDVTAAMIARTATYFDKDYKIKPLLSKILRDVMYETGSYAVAVIPENSIDQVINGSAQITMESLAQTINPDGSIKGIGLLGPYVNKQPTAARNNAGISLENFKSYSYNTTHEGRISFEGMFSGDASKKVDTYITVTDNPNLLKLPSINQKIREGRILGAIGSKAMEAFNPSIVKRTKDTGKMTDRKLTGLLYKDRQFEYKPIASLKTQEQLNRKTVGNPLILHIPSEAVIPVYVPGCMEQHVGYFVLIDQDGNPLNKALNGDHYQQMTAQMNSNGSFPSAMLSRVKSQMDGFNTSNHEHLEYAMRAFGDMVEQDLMARLRNGVYGNGVAVARKEDIYRIMFARALAKQHTQLLFIPIELMTYFAFSYGPNGVGTSVLDKMKVLNSLRSMLLFGNVMAGIKNSIGRTEVKLKLDESDPNPQKTLEILQHEFVKQRQNQFPLGVNAPTDLVNYLQKAAIEFTTEGHPGLPDVQIEIGQKNDNYTKVDIDLSEDLRKKAIMAMGLSPETVDASYQAEFATSVVTNNILLSKRVMMLQDQFTPPLSDHMRKCMMHSEELIKDLRDILVNNFEKLEETPVNSEEVKQEQAGMTVTLSTSAKSEQADVDKQDLINKYLYEFIMNFTVSLPMPNSVTLENQMTAMETYSKALDVALDAWISDKFFTSDTGGAAAAQVGVVKEVLKAYWLRQWMAENGVMPELSHLTNKGPDGKPMVNIFKMQTTHLEAIMESLSDFMVNLKPIKDANDKVMNDAGIEASASSFGTSSDTGSGDDNAGGATELDDINFDGDDNQAGGEENQGGDATADETPETTPEKTSDATPTGDTEEKTETKPEDKGPKKSDDEESAR